MIGRFYEAYDGGKCGKENEEGDIRFMSTSLVDALSAARKLSRHEKEDKKNR
jgi:hypothetical protein